MAEDEYQEGGAEGQRRVREQAEGKLGVDHETAEESKGRESRAEEEEER